MATRVPAAGGDLAPYSPPDLSSWGSWHRIRALLFPEMGSVRGSQPGEKEHPELKQVESWREKDLIPVLGPPDGAQTAVPRLGLRPANWT